MNTIFHGNQMSARLDLVLLVVASMGAGQSNAAFPKISLSFCWIDTMASAVTVRNLNNNAQTLVEGFFISYLSSDKMKKLSSEFFSQNFLFFKKWGDEK